MAWKATEKLVAMRDYQLTIDKLEGLVVARLFELGKHNHSSTGLHHFSFSTRMSR